LIFGKDGVNCSLEDRMIFRDVGIQKEKCPKCGGTVFCDPTATGYRIICGTCWKEFPENEWPPPKEQ